MATRDNSEQAMHEAASWVLELQGGELSKAERKRFANWLRESPANVREYLELSGMWKELETLDADCCIDVEALLEDTNVVPLEPGNAAVDAPPAGKVRRQPLYSMAAAVALVSVALGIQLVPRTPEAPGTETVTTRIGEQRSVALEDGSVVHLNTDSSAAITLDDKRRYIELLTGEAFFTVAKDPGRPFVVRAGGTEVRALGTQFNVRRQDTIATVTVVEGKVAVLRASTPTSVASREPPTTGRSAITAALELTAGQQVSFGGQVAAVKAEQVKTEKVVAWTERRLVFEGDTLSDIVAEFNRYNLNRLEVEDPTIASIRLSAVFGSNDPDSLLEYLTSTEAVVVERQPDGTRVIQAERAP